MSNPQPVYTPGRVITGSDATVTGTVHTANRCLVIGLLVLITVSGALIPEHSGLSQFNEDTGEPSLPVREFHLIACPLVQSS